MKIVFAALFAINLLVGCSVQSVLLPSSEGPSSSMETTSHVVQQLGDDDDSGGGACVCDLVNCDYSTCSCSDACSNGTACSKCCKSTCKSCGGCTNLPKGGDDDVEE